MSEPSIADRWDPALYEGRHGFVWQHGAALLDLLAPRPGERILDLGCGTGHLTAQIAALGAEVIGLDASPAMVEQARRTYPQLTFVVGDARDFTLKQPVDAVLSNAALHWVQPPEPVVDCVRRALQPGGRFVADLGGRGNVQAIRTALAQAATRCSMPGWREPWYFPSLGEYAGLLETGGLAVTFATLFDRPTPLEGEEGLRNWVTMFAGDLLGRVPAEQREQFLSGVEAATRSALYRDGTWHADYRRLRVVAHRPME
jgi:trans-aconitate 2-methyltransferase